MFNLVCIHPCVHKFYVFYIIVHKTIWNRKKKVYLWVNIQFKGHLVSFGYSERIYALCGSEFFKHCPMGNTID